MATLASKGTVTVTLSPGETLNVAKGGQGVAVLKGGQFMGQSFELGSSVRKIGPFGFDMPIVLNSQSGVITYLVERSFSTSDGRDETENSGISSRLYMAPKLTGNDQTFELQEFISDTYSDANTLITDGGKPELVFGPGVGVVNGLTLEPSMRYNFGGAKFLKAQDGAGTFDNSTQSVLRTRLLQESGSWYGQADDIEIIGGTFDCNNKITAAGIVNLFNARNLVCTDMTVVHASVPYAGGFGMNVGGENLKFTRPKVLGGLYVGHDAFHFFFCEGMDVIDAYLEGGDDCFAGGMEPWAEAWCDDIGLNNYTATGIIVRGNRASAVKLYGPSGGVSTGSNRGKHRKGRVSVSGRSGIVRGGGVFIQNEDTTAPDKTMISDVKVYADLDIGSATHDGVNAKGIQVQNATNVSIEGNFRFTDIANATAGYQTINSSALATSLTGLTPATNYTFTVSVDGGAGIVVSVLGSAAPTWLDLLNTIAAFPALDAVAVTEWEGGRIKISSRTTGAASSVAITAGTLFTGAVPASFTSIATAIPGQDTPRFQLGYLHTVDHLDTSVNCLAIPGNGGYNFVDVVNWNLRGTYVGIPAAKYLLTADTTGTTTAIDASGVFASGTATCGFLNPGTGRIAKFVMVGGNITGVTTKINATIPATVYSIQGVTGMTSLIGGLTAITTGNTSIRVTPNTTPRMAYSGGTPGRALQQIKVTPTSSVSAALNWFVTEVDENNFDIQCTVAPGSNAQFSWIVNSGLSVI